MGEGIKIALLRQPAALGFHGRHLWAGIRT